MPALLECALADCVHLHPNGLSKCCVATTMRQFASQFLLNVQVLARIHLR